MVKRPATFRRFLLVAYYNVGVTQVAALGLLALYYTGARAFDLHGPSSGGPYSTAGPPAWFFVISGLLAIVAVFFAWVMYWNGELDEYDNRRHRGNTPSE